MRRSPIISPASGALDGLLRSHDLAAKLRPHLAKALWAEIVGPQVAGVTQVERVQNGTELVVRVKNSVWANELVLLKGDILRRLNLALGGPVLTDLHFKASGLARAKAPPVNKEPPLPAAPADGELETTLLSPDARARIEAAVGGIEDEAGRDRLRHALTRLARASEWKRAHGWVPCAGCGVLIAPSPVSRCCLCQIGLG